MTPRTGRPPLGPDSKHYGFRLPESVMRAVDTYASRKGITRSEAIRLLLERGLRGIKPRKRTR
jgi:metal-responsive CopG/Arc/MetJ family transcriptional regulator